MTPRKHDIKNMHTVQYFDTRVNLYTTNHTTSVFYRGERAQNCLKGQRFLPDQQRTTKTTFQD